MISHTGWLEGRIQSVYQQDPTYKPGSAPFAMEPTPPEDLPDALRGEQWTFVQLPLSVLQEELELVKQVSAPSSVLVPTQCVLLVLVHCLQQWRD